MSKDLQDRLTYGTMSVLLAIVGFIGVKLWAQVDLNTTSIHTQAVVDAAMLEQLKAINSTLVDIKDELKKVGQHEQTYRTGR